jgi:hypothetical protein
MGRVKWSVWCLCWGYAGSSACVVEWDRTARVFVVWCGVVLVVWLSLMRTVLDFRRRVAMACRWTVCIVLLVLNGSEARVGASVRANVGIGGTGSVSVSASPSPSLSPSANGVVRYVESNLKCGCRRRI